VVGDHKTVYVAGGAIIRCYEAPSGKREPTVWLLGSNITLRGRGIIDHENVPRLKNRGMIQATGKNLHVEGLIFRNSSSWTLTFRQAFNVHVDNIKALGHRANSDGVDICNSWDVLVENCFLRTLDDLIVVKTDPKRGGAGRIIARKCVLWNEVAHALSIGAEIREDIDDVLFADCDVIGDHGREWTLRVYHCDNTVVSNVRFENIRIEETVRLANLCIIENVYTTTPGGHIRNVVFKDIVVTNTSNTMTDKFNFVGYDAGHAINNVLIQNVTVEGRQATAADVIKNDYVYNIKVE
jgi:polygalacturonase